MEECVKIWIKMLFAMIFAVVLTIFLPADNASFKAVLSLLSKISKDEILSFENLDDGAHIKIKIDQSNKYLKEFQKFVI